MGMDIGYIRTSKRDQNPDLQRRELSEFGCERFFEEQISSRKQDRPELRAALDYCRPGDRLVVWKLDRLGRSLRELIDLVNEMAGRGVEFVSLRESIDTTTPGGKLVFHVFGSVAEFERDLIRERTMAGLEAARARGRNGGRRRLMDDRQVAMAQRMMADRDVVPGEVARTFGVDWRQRAGWAYARVIEDLPTSITIDQLDAVEASAAGYASAAAREGTGNPTLIPLGATRDGLIVWDCGNLYGSALFTGAPGGGKSCAIRTVIHHCFRYSADWDIYLIDPKRVELGPMRKYPEVSEVATDDGAAEQVLARAAHEQARRYAALERVGVQNIHELNSRLESKGRRRLKHIMVVVDEVAELVELSGGKDEESKEADARKVGMKKSIDSIARLGRAAGVHLILATQRPDATFISGATKSNIQARLAMGGLSSAGSEMTIESPMAANLPGISGRGIWYQSGRLAETQIYYTSMDHMTEASRGGKS